MSNARSKESGMKKLWLGIVGVAAATTANAAVVTYTLSGNDDGLGGGPGSAPGSFAVYAEASAGDNSGLFAYGVDLVDGSVDSFTNLGTIWLYRKTTAPVAPNKFAGFGAGVSEDAAAGKISGVTDLARMPNLIPVYGFGQRDIDMNAFTPAGPRPTGYNISTDQNPNAPGPLVSARMLLGTGTFSAGKTPAWQTSVDNKASVYTSNNGGATGVENVIATLVMNTVGFGGGAVDYVALNGDVKGQNQAVGGAISVTGSNGKYVSDGHRQCSDSDDRR